MLSKLCEFTYNAYLGELRRGIDGSPARRKCLRKLRRWLLRFGDPDIVARLDGFAFQTPFSSNILLFHFEFSFYDSVLPRLAQAVAVARGPLVMVDVGANVGSATFLVSRRTKGSFFCIEANPRFEPSLTHNLGQITGARARFSALNDERKQAVVQHRYDRGNSTIVGVGRGGAALEFLTLDDALYDAPEFAAPNLVKIDCEGFELKILGGARETLRTHRPVLFCEYCPAFIRREGGEPDALFDLLCELGYTQFVFYDHLGYPLTSVRADQPDELRSLRRYCDLRSIFFDVVAIHDADAELGRSFLSAEAQFYDTHLGR